MAVKDDPEDELLKVRWAFEALTEGKIHQTLTYLADFLAIKPPKSAEQRVEDAHRVLARDYQEDVSNIAAELLEEWRSGQFDGNSDSFREAIDQSVDGTQRVIYTGKAQECLLFSRNDGQMLEDMGEVTFKDNIEWSQLAYYAMRQDVIEELEREIEDLYEDPPVKGSSKCTECEKYKPCKDGVCEDCREDD